MLAEQKAAGRGMLTRRDAGAREQCRGLGPAVQPVTRRGCGAHSSPVVPKAGSPCQLDPRAMPGRWAPPWRRSSQSWGWQDASSYVGKGEAQFRAGRKCGAKSKSAFGQEHGVHVLVNMRLMPSCIYHQKYNLKLHNWKPWIPVWLAWKTSIYLETSRCPHCCVSQRKKKGGTVVPHNYSEKPIWCSSWEISLTTSVHLGRRDGHYFIV